MVAKSVSRLAPNQVLNFGQKIASVVIIRHPLLLYSPDQWETIGLHMQSRALLTDEERTKIVEFLKQ
jgi:hypothetical protein